VSLPPAVDPSVDPPTGRPARPPVPGQPGEAKGPGAEALAGLAREVDGLRRRIEPFTELPARFDALTGLVGELTDTVAALTARRGPTPCPTWLLAPASADTVAAMLDELCAWLGAVYLRYPDAASGLPECWCWHPDVVEELLWLSHAWLAAYQGPAAAVGLVADWHDRQRPGVVRRIRQTAGSCSRENHQTREGWPRLPSAAPTVPAADAVEVIATWWGTRRDDTAPEPQPRHAGSLLPTILAASRPR
jgi:hypothetical protein